MQRARHYTALLFTLCVAAYGCQGSSGPDSPDGTAITEFFVKYNEGSYETIYQDASDGYRQSIPLPESIDYLKQAKAKLGNRVSWDPSGIQPTRSSHGSMSYTRADEPFEKGTALVQIKWTYERDAWRLSTVLVQIPDRRKPYERHEGEVRTRQIMEELATGQVSKVYAEAAPQFKAGISEAELETKMKAIHEEFGDCKARGFRGKVGANAGDVFTTLDCSKGTEVLARLRFVDENGVLQLLQLEIPEAP